MTTTTSTVSPLRAKGHARSGGKPVGYVWFVGAGPGGADLITLRGWRALQGASDVLYDSLVDPELLDGIEGRAVFVGKRCGDHSMSQAEICDLLVDLAGRGRKVVRLKGGDPTVLGRVAEEALRVGGAGIPFEIVPGVTSATAVPALAGIPLTHRPLADSFHVATAHRRADHVDFSIPPFRSRTTVVLLMASGTTRAWQSQLLELGYPPTLPVAFISAGCTKDQRVLVSDVARSAVDLEAAALPTPVLAVIGHVVNLRTELAATGSENARNEPGMTDLILSRA